MTDKKTVGGVTYQNAGKDYFEKRGLRRHARVWSLWALGVGAVISGHFSGWNFGIGAGGFGGLFIAAIIIAIMYLGLIFSLAEMSPALPHTGGAYSFARSAMGPWGGFVTGLAESIEYIMTPAVIVFFIGSYLSGIFGDAGRVPAAVVDRLLSAVRRAELLGRRAVVQDLGDRDAARARRAGRVLDQRRCRSRISRAGR